MLRPGLLLAWAVVAVAMLAALAPVVATTSTAPASRSSEASTPPAAPPNGTGASVARTFFVGNETSAPTDVVPGNGGLPYCVAYDALHDRLYVGNWATNFLTVLNASTRSVEGYIPVAVNGTEAVLVANDSLYVVGWNLVLVQVFNLTTEAPIANITTGAGPWAMAFNPQQGLVYVTMDSTNLLTAISDANHTVWRQQPVRASPQSVAYDPQSHEVFVGDDGNDVTVLNASTLAFVTNLTVGAAPWSMAYDAATGQVYVANQDDASFSVIDGSTNTVLGTYGLGTDPNGTAIDPTGAWVYIANGRADNITAIATSNFSDRRDLRLGAGPTGIAYDGATGELVTTNFETNNLSFVDPGTGRINATVVNGVTPTGLAYDPDDGLSYVEDSSGNYVVGLNVSTGAWTPRIPVPAGPSLLRYDPTHDSLWALSPPSGALVRIDPSSDTVVARYAVGYAGIGFAIDDRDGLAFVSFSSSSSVEEFSLANGSALGSWSFLDPTALTYCPATHLLYVLDGFASERITAVAPTSGTTLARAGTGLLASGIVCDPFGRDVYVTNAGSLNVTALDAVTLASAGAIAAPIDGTGADYDWRNAELAVSATFNLPTTGYASDPDALTLLGTVNRTSAGSVSVGAGANVVVYDASADGFLTANSLSGTLSRVAPGTPPPRLASVTVAPTARAIQSGATDPFNGSGVSDYGIPLLEGAQLLWTCVPSDLGTVTPPTERVVNFTAGPTAQNGSLVLTVHYGGQNASASAAIEVLPAPPSPLASVALSPASASLYVGSVLNLTASALLADGDPAPPTTGFVWSVSPATLGTLNTTSGTAVGFTGRAAGHGELFVTAFGPGAPVSTTANLTVTLAPSTTVARVVLALGSLGPITWGSSTPVVAYAYSLDGTNLTNVAAFDWSLVAPAAGSLQPNGTSVNYLAPARNATDVLSVSASFKGTSANASLTLTVIPVPAPIGPEPSHNAPSFWTQRVGPLPGWAWAALGGAAVIAAIAVVALRRRGPPAGAPEVADDETPPLEEGGGPSPSSDVELTDEGPA